MAIHNILKLNNKIVQFDNPNKEYEKLKLYSKEEIISGKWFDGKPVYRKVVEFSSFPNNRQQVSPHHIENLGDVCWYEYSWYDTSDKRFFSGLRFDNSTTYCKVAISHTDLIIEGRGVDWSGRTTAGKCIIYYTKTVD